MLMNSNTTSENGSIKNENLLRLFIGGLKLSTTKETVKQFYDQFGETSSVIIMIDPTTKKSRGFAFVTYANEDGINSAQRARPHVIDDKQVDCKRAIPRDDPNPENRVTSQRIFVGGLLRTITKEQLEEYFSKYGTISECTLVKDKATNQSKGFAFVTFEDHDAVDRIILERPHSIYGSKADVKKALNKDELTALKSKKDSQHAPMPPNQGYGGMPGSGGPPQGYQYYGAPGQNNQWSQQPTNAGNYQTPNYMQPQQPYGSTGNYPPSTPQSSAPPAQGGWLQPPAGAPYSGYNYNAAPPSSNWNVQPTAPMTTNQQLVYQQPSGGVAVGGYGNPPAPTPSVPTAPSVAPPMGYPTAPPMGSPWSSMPPQSQPAVPGVGGPMRGYSYQQFTRPAPY